MITEPVENYAISDQELMNVHVRALFTHDARSRLLFTNEPDNAVIPASRLFLGRTRAGNVWRFRADVPENVCEELNALCADEPPLSAKSDEPPRHLESYLRLLEKHMPVESSSAGLAYHFPEDIAPSSSTLLAVTEKNAEILQGGFEKLIEELPAWQPFVALVQDNRAVSVCRSVRIIAEAHEAGIETLPEFRGKGYAGDVTAEWARLVRASGAIPLYSTSSENLASQAVARKLRLRIYGVNFNVT